MNVVEQLDKVNLNKFYFKGQIGFSLNGMNILYCKVDYSISLRIKYKVSSMRKEIDTEGEINS